MHPATLALSIFFALSLTIPAAFAIRECRDENGRIAWGDAFLTCFCGALVLSMLSLGAIGLIFNIAH